MTLASRINLVFQALAGFGFRWRFVRHARWFLGIDRTCEPERIHAVVPMSSAELVAAMERVHDAMMVDMATPGPPRFLLEPFWFEPDPLPVLPVKRFFIDKR